VKQLPTKKRDGGADQVTSVFSVKIKRVARVISQDRRCDDKLLTKTKIQIGTNLKSGAMCELNMWCVRVGWWRNKRTGKDIPK